MNPGIVVVSPVGDGWREIDESMRAGHTIELHSRVADEVHSGDLLCVVAVKEREDDHGDFTIIPRIVLGTVTQVRQAGSGGRVHLTADRVVEAESGGTIRTGVEAVFGLLGGYDFVVEGLDVDTFEDLVERARRSGTSTFRGGEAPATPRVGALPAESATPPGASPERKSTGARYLVHRNDMPDFVADHPAVVASRYFFQLWRNQQAPFKTIANGDTVYIADKSTRTIVWEARVARLLVAHANTESEAWDLLDAAYGAEGSNFDDYVGGRPFPRYCLGWAPEVIRPLNIPLGTLQLGQNGYRELTREQLVALGLDHDDDDGGSSAPALPIGSPPPWYRGGTGTLPSDGIDRRYIPTAVARAVRERDRDCCVGCGTTENLHIDHRIPYSKGGPATVDNLQMLCARSNLAKGSQGPDVPLACSPAKR